MTGAALPLPVCGRLPFVVGDVVGTVLPCSCTVVVVP